MTQAHLPFHPQSLCQTSILSPSPDRSKHALKHGLDRICVVSIYCCIVMDFVSLGMMPASCSMVILRDLIIWILMVSGLCAEFLSQMKLWSFKVR